MVMLDGRMLAVEQQEKDQQQGRATRAFAHQHTTERKVAGPAQQVRKPMDGYSAPHPPSRIAGTSLAPVADTEACDRVHHSPRQQPQQHQHQQHQQQHMQHPNNHETQDCQQHSGLAAHHHHLQGRGYPFHKKLGQLRVAVPKQLASFHSHEQQQQDNTQQLRAEGKALSKQQGPKQNLDLYRELNEADSLCGTPPSLSLEALSRAELYSNHPMGPLNISPLSPSNVLTICSQGSFDFWEHADNSKTVPSSASSGQCGSPVLPEMQACQSPKVPSV